jgi:hypothetical protein
MRAEWQRRLVAIFITTLYAGLSRLFEPAYAKLGLNPVWITRFSAVAILLICFKLADRIPDSLWPHLELPSRPRFAAYAFLLAFGFLVLDGLFIGEAY